MTKTYVCDFETTVYDKQEFTEVWAAACAEIDSPDEESSVMIFHSIEEQFNFFIEQNVNIIAYYHNLKFDGSFWIDYLLIQKGMQQAVSVIGDDETETVMMDTRKGMPNNSFNYMISDMGQWYKITIKINNKYIELRDSLKLLPFSVKNIGKSFGTKHKKLDMEYTGYRYAGCNITDDEKHYIANDVLVIKEALQIMFSEGHDKLTIGACCFSEFKSGFTKDDFEELFPQLYDINIGNEYGCENAGEYIRKSYHGGWCYVVKGKENKIFKNGVTADVNSLYPSVMSSEGGCLYPIGTPTFWKGNFIPDLCRDGKHYFFVRIKTKFFIKYNMLPFIQMKGNILYRATEMLTTSNVYNKKDGKYYEKIRGFDGEEIDTYVELTLTMTDYDRMLRHYELIGCEILDGCYFSCVGGIFDEYINKYRKIKMESKGAKRTLAKLYLNNLYGKMATNTDSSFKLAFENDNVIGFTSVKENNKKGGYIAIGSAITSYAREFTINAAQANYYGVNKRGFIYADTDSLHMDLSIKEIKNVPVHPTEFCHWKIESGWDKAIFVRAKTYIEHVVINEDGEMLASPYNDIKCAGMPDRCKALLNLSIEGIKTADDYAYYESLTQCQKDFVDIKRSYKDFKTGLIVPGKLLPKRIPGGIVLQETTFEMREI